MIVIGAWGAALILALALTWLTQKQRAPGRIRRRTDDHESYLAFLMDILDQPAISALMVRQGTTTVPALAAFRATMGQLSEPMLRACAGKLLSDRIVRRQVARFLEERRGMRKRCAMGALGQIVERVRV